MLCVPADSELVEKMATPLPLTAPVPWTLVPSTNLTEPVGVPAPGATAVTVAVNVTDWPKTDGDAIGASAVVVLAGLTVCERVAELLPMKFVLPTYSAT